MKKIFLLLLMAVSALYAVTNETTISGATGVQIYLRNYSYANLALSMPRLSIGLATDNNRLVYKNSAGTTFKLLTDASGASNATAGRIFYSDANGAATSSSGLTYDGSTLDVAGLARADSASVSDLRVGDSTIGNYAIFEKSIKTDTFTVKYGIVGEGDWTRQLNYRTNTVDGSDNKGIGLYSYGDGMYGFGRGAYIEAYGNEYGEFRGGDIDIVAGEGSGTDVGDVHIRSNNGTISLNAELGVNVNNKLDVAGLAKADSVNASEAVSAGRHLETPEINIMSDDMEARYWTIRGDYASSSSDTGGFYVLNQRTSKIPLYIAKHANNNALIVDSAGIKTSGAVRTEYSSYTRAPLRIGAYYLWIDLSGRLRIKGSAPTSDTDGTVVGSQS
jgi:hypothetical protein